MKEDGTVLLSWANEPIPGISVNGWKLFDSIDTFNEERRTEEKKFIANAEKLARQKREEEERLARQKKEEEARISAERRNAGLCRYCGGVFKGLFSKKCSLCGRPKDY